MEFVISAATDVGIKPICQEDQDPGREDGVCGLMRRDGRADSWGAGQRIHPFSLYGMDVCTASCTVAETIGRLRDSGTVE